jgi:hypothetical protein
LREELLFEYATLSFQNQDHLIEDFVILFAADVFHAGRHTLLHLVVEAGPGAVVEDIVRAGAKGKQVLQSA